MKRFYRVLRRKRNVRRILAAAFLVIAFIEIGSHVFNDSEDLAHFETLGFCGIQHEPPLAVDSPSRQKQRGPNSNLTDEMVIHAAILNDFAAPRCGISYWTSDHVKSIVRPLFGNLSPPFHPPKLA
jgi:hypothetical protein